MNEWEEDPAFQRGHAERTMITTTCSIFNDFCVEGHLCDVVIQVKGDEFNAHKNILCGCSSYFRVLFSGRWHPSEERLYRIPDVSPDIMRLIIKYAYTSSVAVTAGNVEALLIAADQYRVMGVVRVCCEFLEGQLCLENSINIWKFSDIYNCPDLKHKAFLFILQHFEKIICVSKEFLDLTLQQLAVIIEQDKLNVKKEDVVFEAIVRWIGHSPDERKAHIAVLLPKVRLALMSPSYFMNNVNSHALVRDNTGCIPVITNVWRAMCDLKMNGPSHNYNPLARPRLPYEILLAIGGWSDDDGPINGMEAYNPRADRWVNKTTDEESPRAFHGVAFLSGFVYCIGGRGCDNVDSLNTVHRFNPVTRTWRQAAPMHSPRSYVSVAVLNGCIYALGGFDGHEELNTAERYDPETNQWTLIAPMHEKRIDASATALHGKVYICGGFNETGNLCTAECYSPETNQWTMIEPMRTSRCGVGVIAYGEHIYAVGGFDGEKRLYSAEAYNPQTNTWQDVSNMSHPRSNFGIEVVDDRLVVVGGHNFFTTTSVVEYYSDKSRKWYKAQDMGTVRSGLSCCVLQRLPKMDQYTAPPNSRKRKRELLEDRPNKVFRPDLPGAGSSGPNETANY